MVRLTVGVRGGVIVADAVAVLLLEAVSVSVAVSTSDAVPREGVAVVETDIEFVPDVCKEAVADADIVRDAEAVTVYVAVGSCDEDADIVATDGLPVALAVASPVSDIVPLCVVVGTSVVDFVTVTVRLRVG